MRPILQGVIDNQGPNNLRDQIRTLLDSSRGVDIEVAFVTRSGVRLLLPWLRRVASKQGSVRILTGLYQFGSEPEALRLLLEMAQNAPDWFKVRVSTHATFHKKLFIFRRPKSVQILLGSANLSAEGLTSAGELAILLSASPSDPMIRRIQAGVERDWEERSQGLSRKLIARYAKRYRRGKATRPADGGLKEVLGRSPQKGGAGPDKAQGEPPAHRYWRDAISGHTNPKTDQIVHTETGWDRRGLEWYAHGPRAALRGDGLLLIDHPDNRVIVAEVVEKAHLPQSTPDGRYFLAFRPIRSCRIRRLSKSVDQDLKAAGLRLHVRRYGESKLSQKTWDAIRQFFRK